MMKFYFEEIAPVDDMVASGVQIIEEPQQVMDEKKEKNERTRTKEVSSLNRLELQSFRLGNSSKHESVAAIEPPCSGGATLCTLDEQTVYLMGGADRQATHFSNVYALDLRALTWKKIETKGMMTAKSGHSAVACGKAIYVFGGINIEKQEVYNDVEVLNTETMEWRTVCPRGAGPSPRNSHTAVMLPDRGLGYRQMIVFGGSSPEEGYMNDVFVLNIKSCDDLEWEKKDCIGDLPSQREQHAACVVENRATNSSQVYVSGGRLQDQSICSDMLVLDTDSWSWSKINNSIPYGRCSHVMRTIAWEDKIQIIMFGGWGGGTNIYGDFKVFDLDDKEWQSCDVRGIAPEERFGHASCVAKDRLIIFGGMNVVRDLNDVHFVCIRHNKSAMVAS